MNCLATYKVDSDNFIQNYWVQSGTLDFLNKMDYFKIAPSLIKDIFVKETTTTSTVSSLIYEEEIGYGNVIAKICQHLFHRGYLTLDSKNIYKIPNEEIRGSLEALL